MPMIHPQLTSFGNSLALRVEGQTTMFTSRRSTNALREPYLYRPPELEVTLQYLIDVCMASRIKDHKFKFSMLFRLDGLHEHVVNHLTLKPYQLQPR